MLEDTLRTTGNFLTLSRRHPALMESPFIFHLGNGTQVTVLCEGIIIFEPPSMGTKDIILSSGVHGNETAPIEICDDLVTGILKEEILIEHRVLFIFANLAAMDIGERFVEENMNRLFPKVYLEGKGLEVPERYRAKQCDDAVEYFLTFDQKETRERLHLDLHTAIRASKHNTFAVYPYLDDAPHSESILSLMADCGVNTILLSSSAATTFSYNSWSRFNVHALTVELGKVRPFGENDMSQFAAAKSTLEKLICGTYTPREFKLSDFEIFEVNQVVIKRDPDFRLHFSESTPNFTSFAIGDVVASGSSGETIIEVEGEAIVFPNAGVKIGERAMLTVKPGQLTQ